MKPHSYTCALIAGVIHFTFLSICIAQQDTTYLKLVNTIVLQNISGRLGHMAYNEKQGVVYLAALSNNTMEVVDLQNKKTIRSVKSLRQPIDVEYVSNINLVFVACLGDGLCRAFNTNTFKEETSFRFDNNVSLVRYSPASQMLYIGYGEGAIALIDGNTLKYKTTIKLPVHPEAMVIDENTAQMFVTLPKSREIGVIDLKNNILSRSFSMANVAENYPVAYDKTNKRLFVGCRKPAKLVVVNSENGNKIAEVDIDGDVNVLYYDEARKQIYVTCGDGYLHVIKQEFKEVKQQIQESKSTASQQGKAPSKTGTKNQKTSKQPQKKPAAKPSQPQYRTVVQDSYTSVSRIFTGNGARTSLYVPALSQIVVASPAATGKEAQLLIYQVK